MNRCLRKKKNRYAEKKYSILQEIKRKLLFVMALFVLALLCSTDHVYAAEKTPKAEDMEVSSYDWLTSAEPAVLVSEELVGVVNYGFNQQARYGRSLELRVTVYNKAQTMSGAVSAVLINKDQDNVEYQTETVFNGGDKTEVILYLPMNQTTESLCIKIHNSKKTVVEATIPLNIMNYGGSYFLGILDEAPEKLSYFDYFGNKTVLLNESNFPSDILGLDMLDAVVVNHFNLDQLSTNQLQALITWTKNGGNLILGIDNDTLPNIELMDQYRMVDLLEKIDYEDQDMVLFPLQLFDDSEFNTVLSKIKDYETVRKRLIEYVEEKKEEIPSASINIYIGNSMLGTKAIDDLKNTVIRKKVTQFSITQQDYSNDTRNDQIRLYDKVSFGKGVIQIYHFNLQNPKLTKDAISLYEGANDELLSGIYSGIAAKTTSNFSTVSMDRITEELYADGQSYRVYNLNSILNTTQIPKVTRYIVLMIIYILLIGPVLWSVLKKKRKQQFLWLAVPALSLLFVGFMYVAGKNTRITDPYVSYMDFELYDTDNNMIYGNIYAGITMPQKNSHRITLSNAVNVASCEYSYPDYYNINTENSSSAQTFYDSTFSNQKIVYNGEGAILTIDGKPAFESNSYQIGYQIEGTEKLDCNIKVTPMELTGTITNTLSTYFEDALIYCNGIYIDIGEFAPGSQADLSQTEKAFALNTDSLYYGSNPVSKKKGTDTEEGLVSNDGFINAMGMIYDRYLKNQDGAYFIGLKKSVSMQCPIYELAQEKASSGVSIVIIPVKADYSIGQSIFVPSIDSYLVTDDRMLWEQEFRIAYLNTLELAYHFPQEDKITSIILTDIFSEEPDETIYDPNRVRLYFYNYRTDKYDLIFDLDSSYTMRSISDQELEPYLNEKNEMKIKYETRNTEDTSFSIPVISCIREASNAQN